MILVNVQTDHEALMSFRDHGKSTERLEATVRELRDDLINIGCRSLPEPTQKHLQYGFYRCETALSARDWLEISKTLVIDAAEPIDRNPYTGPRAYCPLCGCGSNSPYDRGFKLPTGLQWHLEGHGNTQACSVFKALIAKMRDACGPKFEEEEERNRTQIAKRRSTDLQYRLGPGKDPLFVDEGMWGDSSSRDVSEFEEAERKLISLGLTKRTDGVVISYVLDRPHIEIYADPRFAGRLNFFVYPKRPKAKKAARLPWPTVFYLLEKWADLPGKFSKRLKAAESDLGFG